MSARTATQAMAVTRLDGEADEHGSDAAMASGDAVCVLDQVVRDARQAAGIIALQGAWSWPTQPVHRGDSSRWNGNVRWNRNI